MMKNIMTKNMKALILALLMIVSVVGASVMPVAALSGTVSAQMSEAAATTQAFSLGMTAAVNAKDSSVIDVVISVKNITQELNGVEFTLDFNESLVDAVITQQGAAMDAFMTVTPMYTFVVPGTAGNEVPVSRYEQICTYNAANGSYVCRFLDLLSYDYAKEGEVYRGLIKDGDLVVTIQFRLHSNVADGTRIAFSATDVKGTTRAGLNSVSGGAASATYTKTTPQAPVVTPTIKLKYPALSFKDEIVLDVFYDTEGLEDAVQMGLLVYGSNVSSWSVFNAEQVVPGYKSHAESGLYYATTHGIPAKCLGDTIYFAVYALRSNGEYVYSKLVSYSPKTYAYSQLSTGSTEMKALVVAMLNYGAAAQVYFNYNTSALVNSSLTAAQKALVKAYSPTMVDAVDSVNNSKVGIFSSTGGFSKRYPSITFEGAFCIDYYFTPSYTPSGDVRMYYWTEADYKAATTLSSSNATGCIVMTNDGTGVYHAVVEGIAAKDLDSTIYVSGGYMSGGKAYCTGVLAYSVGAYCTSQASYAGDMQPLAKATAVYGYYAKQLFNEAA